MTRGTLHIEVPYKPMAKQREAHGLSCKYRGFCGGWGNGKTSWGCAETFFRCVEFPKMNVVVARKTRLELKNTTWDMLLNGDTSLPYAWHGLPNEVIASYNKADLILTLINGCRIMGLPLDDINKIENMNLGLVWVDQAEEIEEEFFFKFNARLRQHHSPREGLFTWNPAGHNWLWKRFIDPDRPGKWQQLYRAVEATTFDNPHLPEDYIDQFEGLPDFWIQRFLHGSHDVFVGQIFTDWHPEIHIVQPFRLPELWERWCCIDPGIRNEGAVSWVARDSLGNAYYYRELLAAGQPISWWSERMYEMEARDDYGGPWENVQRRFIGPEARQRAQTDGRSVIDVFHEHGIFPEIADRDPTARINVITAYLRPKTDHVNPWTGDSPAPRLYVFADCAKLIEYLPQYQWRPTRVNIADEDEPEKPRKKDDHNVDNLGHILLAVAGLPEVPDYTQIRDPETREFEEHFERIMAEASHERSHMVGPI